MSYGVWRKRGKGWSAITVDSPWNYTFYDMSDRNRADQLMKKSGAWGNDNPHLVQWLHTQESKGWETEELPTGGEHCFIVAYPSKEYRMNAILANKDRFWYSKWKEMEERRAS